MVLVKIVRLKESAKLPSYAHEGDAGLDIFSAESCLIEPGKRKLISTGISMELPSGYVGLIWDKSGLALKKGITVLGGVIDSGYRGECRVILQNLGEETLKIRVGDKIAQLIIQEVARAEIEEAAVLSDSSRADGGFGSTGGTSSLES